MRGGEQKDQMQRLRGEIRIYRALHAFDTGVFKQTYTSGSDSGAVSYENKAPMVVFDSADSPDARTSATTAGETRPINKTIRIWERIS